MPRVRAMLTRQVRVPCALPSLNNVGPPATRPHQQAALLALRRSLRSGANQSSIESCVPAVPRRQ